MSTVWYSHDPDNHVRNPEALSYLAAALQEYEAGVVSSVCTNQDEQFITAHGVAEIDGKIIAIEVGPKPGGGWTVVFSTPTEVDTSQEMLG